MLVLKPEEFDLYTNNFDDNELKEYYCSAAQTIVEKYLGYQLEEAEYTEKIKGYPIKVGVIPITNVTELTIDGELIDTSKYTYELNKIILDEDVSITKRSISEITYTGGYSTITETIEGEEVTTIDAPSIIKVAVLKIASLLMLEEGGNIGVTGVSTPDGLGRTFINYSNYTKHLQILKNYRVVRL